MPSSRLFRPDNHLLWMGILLSVAVTLYVGMQVRHEKFGIGDLIGWSGSGSGLRLNLRFPDRGMKTILARFCEPL